jgi:hypothetical protein
MGVPRFVGARPWHLLFHATSPKVAIPISALEPPDERPVFGFVVAERTVANPPIPADKGSLGHVRFWGAGQGGWMTGVGAKLPKESPMRGIVVAGMTQTTREVIIRSQ